MSDFDLGFRIAPGAFVVLVAIVLAIVVPWSISVHFTWSSRVRRLLEHEGFIVREMERRWLTRGPFPDLRPPGLKHHKEWLVRVVVEDRAHLPRTGWVRWRRKWPWEAADTWAVRWDEASAHGPAGRRPGLSTVVFMALVLPPALAGLVAAAYLLGRSIQQPQGAEEPRQTTGEPVVYEIRCRGGEGVFRLRQRSGGLQTEATGQVWVAQMSLDFRASPRAAGADAAGLEPGTCSWIDRPLNELEPRSIRFEAPAIHTTSVPHAILPEPGRSPDDNDLRDPVKYWSFFVFNTNQGFLQATSYRRWNSATRPANDRPIAPPSVAHSEIVQRFVCERSYTNFARGYQHSGFYVDREGGVYRFSVEAETLAPSLPPPDPTEAGIEATYGSGIVLVGRVAADELLAMFRLIPAAARAGYSKRVSAGADRGALVSACYLFDAAQKRYRAVELDVKGDWEYRNLAPEAETLAKWLMSLERPPEHK
jgi:hypothetical protein